MGLSRRFKFILIFLASGVVVALGAVYYINARLFPDVSAEPWLAAAPGELPEQGMSGRWVQRGQWVDGRPVAGARIDAQTFTLTHPGENLAQILETRCRIVAADADADPKWFDAEIISATPRESFWHSYVGQRMNFAYEIKDDRLYLVCNVPGSGERPTSMEPGRNTWMFLDMRRAGEAAAAEADSDRTVTQGDGVTLAADLLGEWDYIDELVMTLYPDTLILTAGPEGPIVAEMEILNWDKKSSPARIDAVMIKHPELQQLGQRVRMIYEMLPNGRQRVASYYAESPGYGSWPTGFTGTTGKGLVVGEWELIKP